MKRFRLLLIFLMLFSSSCTKEPPKAAYTWTGQEQITHLVPVCIVWYNRLPRPETIWRPYKAFSQEDANDMRNIILNLVSPEKKESNQILENKDKLSLIFYNGFPEKLTVREVYFEIKDHTFIGPRGKSDVIATILLDRKEIRPGFYSPYSDLDPIHYRDFFYRILDSQESLRKQSEEMKIKRQTHDRETVR
jgi:hypothetical protein